MIKKYPLIFILAIIVSFVIVVFNYYIISAQNNKPAFIKSEENLTDENIQQLLVQAKSEYYQGNISGAQTKYESILKYRSNTSIALKNLYFITKEKGNIHLSSNYLKKIIINNPENNYWQYKLGINLYLESNINAASLLLEKVYKKHQTNIKESTNNLKLEDNTNLYKNEVVSSQEAIQKNDINNYLIEESSQLTEKEFSILCYYLGQINFSIGNYELAESYYLKGIDATSHIILNYIGLANLYKFREEYEKSIEYYTRAIKKDSSLSSIYPRLAELHELIEDESQAFYYWNRSFAANIEKNYAKSRIDEISRQNPEFIIEEREAKDLSRADINWLKLKDYSLDTTMIPSLRIGIVENVNKVSFKAGTDFAISNKDIILIEGKGKENYSIEYYNYKYKIYHNDELIKIVESKEPIKLIMKDKTFPFLLYDMSYGQGYFWAGSEDRQYRGEIEMYPRSQGKFHIINKINLEEYLFSVVPAEMPAWWPDEALKAQTIAARSYALSHLGKHNKEGYDLCDTVHCAAYNGVKSETNKTNQLILETMGEIAVYNNNPITAVFSSNSGGYSENSKEIWGNEYAYLSGANNMSDLKYNFPLEPYNIERWLIEEPESFSNVSTFTGSNIYRWIKVLDDDFFTKKYNLKSLVNIIPIGRTNGGTINKIIIKGIIDDGTERIIEIKGDSIRSALGGLKSNRFTIEKLYNNNQMLEQLIFYGSGWGHNVGMDQTGAAGMAQKNYDYKDIINHFYKNITIDKRY